jgi:hypothetical protein
MKKTLSSLLFLVVGAFCFALTKPVALNKIMTAPQELQLYKEASFQSKTAEKIPQDTIVAIQKIGQEDIIGGIKSNWVYVEVLDEAKYRSGKIAKKGAKGWCFGAFLDDVNVMKNKFANPYVIRKDGVGTDSPLYGKETEQFFESEIVEADESKTKDVSGTKWYYIRKLNSTKFSYFKENSQFEPAIEKIEESEPAELFGYTYYSNDWDGWTIIKDYWMENIREFSNGDYYVNKIFANSVQYDLISPYEYRNLALHVEDNYVWLYDTSTLQRIFNEGGYDYDNDWSNKVRYGRWNDCDWTECGSLYTEYLYHKMPCHSGYFWGHYYEGDTYVDLFNPYMDETWHHGELDIATNYCMYYKEDFSWQDVWEYDSDEEKAFLNRFWLFAGSIDHGIQNEYTLIFGNERVEPEIFYDIRLPHYLLLNGECKAYSTDNFTKGADLILKGNGDYNSTDLITLTEMVQTENGVYYKADYAGKNIWIYEYDLPPKSVYVLKENINK